MTCYKIDHERMGGCNNRRAKYIITANTLKVKEFQSGVLGYTKDKAKICLQVKAKCANCRKSHMINLTHFNLRQKASIKVDKEIKFRKNCEKKNEGVASKNGNGIRERDTSLEPKALMDLDAYNKASSLLEWGL